MEDLPITPNLEHVDSPIVTTTSPGHSQSSMFMLVLGVGIVVVLLAAGAFFYMQQANKKASDLMYTDMTANRETPLESEGQNVNVLAYNNADFGISFALDSGEEVIECPTKDLLNDTLRLWVVQPGASVAESQCDAEGVPETIFLSKKSTAFPDSTSYLAILDDPDTGYTLSRSEAMVSGQTVMRVYGQRGATAPTSLPESIDTLVFDKNGALYVIPSTYLTRELQVR
jgi:hypothetical protein